MTFTRSELEMIYPYAATDRAATVAGLAEIVPVLKDPLTKAIVKNTIDKLEKIPEPECSCFIADIKARFLKERDNSIRRLAEAKAQAKEPIMQGHDLTGFERYLPQNRHMIVVDILSNDSPVGYKGERYRFFLSDEGYKNAKASEQRGEAKIRSHAAVCCGSLYPYKKPGRDR